VYIRCYYTDRSVGLLCAVFVVCSVARHIAGASVFRVLFVIIHEFLDAFAKLKKPTVDIVMSVRPSAWNIFSL
jgi:hypothetical protein